MNLRFISDEVLWQRTEALAAEERRTTLAVLYHLREIERRMLYAKRGFSNLKDYCTQVLKYSESSAYRRIASMHLLKDVPELDQKFQSGEITLSNAAQVQTHFHKVKKQTKKDPSIEEKRTLLTKIDSLSSRSCERLLGEARGDSAPAERSRPINANETEYSFTIDRETEELLKEIQRELHRTLSLRELVKEMAKITVKALREKRHRSDKRGNLHQATAFEKKLTQKPSLANSAVNTVTADNTPGAITADGALDISAEKRNQPPSTVSAMLKIPCSATPTPKFCGHGEKEMTTRKEIASRRTNSYTTATAADGHSRQQETNSNRRTRYISVSAERELWERAGARCQYIDLKTGKRCEGTRHLQIEHLQPHALGGSNELDNLELLCPAHNRLRAVTALGPAKMRRFVPSLRI